MVTILAIFTKPSMVRREESLMLIKKMFETFFVMCDLINIIPDIRMKQSFWQKSFMKLESDVSGKKTYYEMHDDLNFCKTILIRI
jgi:hypothetical protein